MIKEKVFTLFDRMIANDRAGVMVILGDKEIDDFLGLIDVNRAKPDQNIIPEVELKVLEIDQSAIEKKLIDLGARLVFSGDIKADFFDFPDRRLKNNRQKLRWRRHGEAFELVVKTKIMAITGAKANEELEFEFKNGEGVRDYLLEYGLTVVDAQPSKTRLSYALDDAHFEFDTPVGVPTFLEVEADSVEKVRAWIKKLGIDDEQAKDWNMRDVLDYYGK